MLEQNLSGLSSHLEQGARKGYGSPMERAAHWFRAIGDSEPDHTYLKKASTDLARTCESMEGQLRDSDEVLFIQNLHSLTDYVRVTQVSCWSKIETWTVLVMVGPVLLLETSTLKIKLNCYWWISQGLMQGDE